MELTILREEKGHRGTVIADEQREQAFVLAQLEGTVKGLEALVEASISLLLRGGICRKEVRRVGVGAGRVGRAVHSTARSKKGREGRRKESASEEQPKAAAGLVSAGDGKTITSTNPFDCLEATPCCESAPAIQEYDERVLEANMESIPETEEHAATLDPLNPNILPVCHTLPVGHLHVTPSSSYCNHIDAGRFNPAHEKALEANVLHGRTEVDIAHEARHVDLKQVKTTLALIELSPDCQSSQHSTGSFFSPDNFSTMPWLSDEGKGVDSKLCAFPWLTDCIAVRIRPYHT